jgi:DNA-binding transcriptional regulator YbjK
MVDRQQRLLDAAIETLATGGMRQLTHRAVDATAGLPAGSASNRFRTREALIVGVLGRILERETALWTRLAIDTRISTIEAFAVLIGRLLMELADGERELSQARRAIFVDAANEPVLRETIGRAREEILSWMAPLLAELGSTDPARDVQYLLALMDGLAGHQLVSPAVDYDPATAVGALLHGLIDGSGR